MSKGAPRSRYPDPCLCPRRPPKATHLTPDPGGSACLFDFPEGHCPAGTLSPRALWPSVLCERTVLPCGVMFTHPRWPSVTHLGTNLHLCVHSSVDGHWSCSLTQATMNSVAGNSLWLPLSSLLWAHASGGRGDCWATGWTRTAPEGSTRFLVWSYPLPLPPKPKPLMGRPSPACGRSAPHFGGSVRGRL